MAKWVKTIKINKYLWFNTQNDDFNFHHKEKKCNYIDGC